MRACGCASARAKANRFAGAWPRGGEACLRRNDPTTHRRCRGPSSSSISHVSLVGPTLSVTHRRGPAAAGGHSKSLPWVRACAPQRGAATRQHTRNTNSRKDRPPAHAGTPRRSAAHATIWSDEGTPSTSTVPGSAPVAAHASKGSMVLPHETPPPARGRKDLVAAEADAQAEVGLAGLARLAEVHVKV